MGIIEIYTKGVVFPFSYPYPEYSVDLDTKIGLISVINTNTEMRVLMIPMSELKYVVVRESEVL